MAAREPTPALAPPRGPFLAAAVLCERVLTEQDGVLSLIRIVDRITQTAVGPETPDEMPAFPVNLTAVIVLKSGSARGRHSVRITLEAPSGQEIGQEVILPVLLEGEDRGVNLVVNLGFQAEHEGIYWVNVHFGSQKHLLTRVPLRVVYQPQRLGAASTGPGG